VPFAFDSGPKRSASGVLECAVDRDWEFAQMSHYSIPDLLELLKEERGERVQIKAGYSPVLVVKGESHEIEGPMVMEESVEAMLRDVASTRDLRAFRRDGKLDVVVRLRDTDFLVRAIRAFGECRLEMQPVPV